MEAQKTGGERQVMIGLEIHGYLDVLNKAKLFCNCSLEPGEPNTRICPVCTGQPGAKPMLPNREAIDAILRIALFLECKLNPQLMWQRKHYSWPDLPNGYQKTMSGAYSQPVGLHGSFLGVGIEEIHLEEDPARWDPVSGGVDYNRSGYPLCEIVTKPEFTSAAHAREWLESLMVALGYLKAVRRELGVKCDVNVSVAPDFIRTEVKNVNSFTAIERAIAHEIVRQNAQKREDRTQQTRAWDETSGTTLFMRSKETALDYAFIPDPDLPVIEITDEIITPIKTKLPERPDQKQRKYVGRGITEDAATKLASNLVYANYAEAVTEGLPAELFVFIADRFNNEVRAVAFDAASGDNKPLIPFERFEQHLVSVPTLRDLFHAQHRRDIDNLTMKALLKEVGENTGESIARVQHALKHAHSNKQSDSALLPLVKAAILAKPEAASDVKGGNMKAINAIVGHVLSALKAQGKSADPAVVQALIKEELNVQ